LATPFSRTTRSLAGSTPVTAWLAWGCAGLGLAAWGAWFLLGHVTVLEFSRSARLEVQQAAHLLVPALGGRVRVNHLELGQAVAAGEVLLELDATADTLRLHEEQARAAGLAAQAAALRAEIVARRSAAGGDREAAHAALAGARARTREAATAAAFAADQARRLREENDAGSVAAVDAQRSGAEADQRRAAADAIGAEAHRIEAEAHARSAAQGADASSLRRMLAALDAEHRASQAVAERLALLVEQHRVRAPVAGRVAELRPLHPGEMVTAGQAVGSVVPGGALVVVAEFDPATALGRVHAGQAATLRLDAFPWAQYGVVHATVSRVSGEVRDRLVRVELTPRAPWPAGFTAQHGLPGSVEVSVERLPPAQLLLRASGHWLARAEAVATADGATPPAARP